MSPAVSIGQTYHSWTVTSRYFVGAHGKTRWGVVCLCGRTNIVIGSALKSGRTKQCLACSNKNAVRSSLFTPEIEARVVALRLEGKRRSEIAAAVGLRPKTIENYLRRKFCGQSTVLVEAPAAVPVMFESTTLAPYQPFHEITWGALMELTPCLSSAPHPPAGISPR